MSHLKPGQATPQLVRATGVQSVIDWTKCLMTELPFHRGMQTASNIMGNEQSDSQASADRERVLAAEQMIVMRLEEVTSTGSQLTQEIRQDIMGMLDAAFSIASLLGEALGIIVARFIDNDPLLFSMLRTISDNGNNAADFISDSLVRLQDPKVPKPEFVEVAIPEIPADAPPDLIQSAVDGTEVTQVMRDLNGVANDLSDVTVQLEKMNLEGLKETLALTFPAIPEAARGDVTTLRVIQQETLGQIGGDLDDAERRIKDQTDSLEPISKELKRLLDTFVATLREKLSLLERSIEEVFAEPTPVPQDPNDVINAVESAYLEVLGQVAIFGDTSDAEFRVTNSLEDLTELVSNQLTEDSRTRAEGAVDVLTGIVGVDGKNLKRFAEENIDNPPELEKMLRKIQDQLNVIRAEFGIERSGGGAPGQVPLRRVRLEIPLPPERVAVDFAVRTLVADNFPTFLFDTTVQKTNSTFVVTVNFTPDTSNFKDEINQVLGFIRTQVEDELGVDVRIQAEFTFVPEAPPNPPTEQQREQLEDLSRQGFIVRDDATGVSIEELDEGIESGDIDAETAEQMIVNGLIAQDIAAKCEDGATVPSLDDFPEGVNKALLNRLVDAYRKNVFEISIGSPGTIPDDVEPEVPIVT